ncbi:tetratricopeptide repeat protein [Hydrogenimonas sp.]
MKRAYEKNRPFSILHIRDEKPFHCESYYDENGKTTLFSCRFTRKPETSLQPVVSDFFTIAFRMEERGFRMEITPKTEAFLQPLPPPVHENPILPAHSLKNSRHWVVVGYRESIPYLGAAGSYEERLSFPLDVGRYAMPSVGAVDINGDPVFLKKNRDIEKLMAIKAAFEAKKYKKAYELANEALELYPDSIFSSDFLRYKIKALMEENMKEHAEEIIKLGKYFIKHYTSDEYLPEILLLLARVYGATGLVSDANYFYNRLIHEHKGNRFANLGLIYLGDQLYINGNVKDATKNYLEAYYSARDLDVASLAAYKLAMRYLDRGKTKEAVKYLRKIWEKNRSFLLKDPEDAHSIAVQLASHGAYDLAIEIDEELLGHLHKLDEMYETILFEIAEWYDEKGDVEHAVYWYDKYLDQFAYGKFSDKAKEKLDTLFVVRNDVDATEALERYETIMREYRGTSIADRALAAKMKVMVSQGRYAEVLGMETVVTKIADAEAKKIAEKAIREAAEKLFRRSVEKGECETAVKVVENHLIERDAKGDEFLYGCYASYAKYEEAMKIVEKYLRSAHDVSERERWLCRALHLLVRLGRYEKALDAADELHTLSEKAQTRCPSLVWDEIRAIHETGRYAEEMERIKRMTKRHGDDIRMVEVYRKGYESAKKAGDTLQQIWLLKRLIALQNRKGSHLYSPWAEFEAIRLLKARKRFEDALEIALGMKALRLKGEAAARWRYETGLLYRTLGKRKKAVENFEICAKTANGGAWSRLCREASTLEEF